MRNNCSKPIWPAGTRLDKDPRRDRDDITRFGTGGDLASGRAAPAGQTSGSRRAARNPEGQRYRGAITARPPRGGQAQTREGARYRRIARRRGKPQQVSPSATPS